jgi:hypothetical protein
MKDPYEESEALRLYRKALRYADEDPEVSLTLARQAAEAVLFDICIRQNKAITGKPTLENLLHTLTITGSLPSRILLPLRTIQSYGNYGSHAHSVDEEMLTLTDIQPCLGALSQVLTWHGVLLNDTDAEESRRLLARVRNLARIARIADSTLIVVKAILIGWRMEQVLSRYAYDVNYVQLPWDDELIRQVSEGLLEAAVYNERRIIALMQSHRDIADSITVAGRFGHSMGGRNFYLLASRNGRWADCSAQQFLQNPEGALVAVPKDSDMFANLLVALDVDASDLPSIGVQILDVPHHLGLELFHLNHDVLVVGGQNLRVQASLSPTYFELLNADMLSLSQQKLLWKSAANALIVNNRWLSNIGGSAADLHGELLRNFYWTWTDASRYEDGVGALARYASFPQSSTQEDRQRLVKRVLYETYRLGEPS